MLIKNWASHKLALFIYTILIVTLVACQAETANTVPAPTTTPIPKAPSTPPEGVFWIDPARDLGEISKFVLGANHGPWSDLGVGNLEPAKNAGITFLRWPGGNWGDQNDVQTYQIDNYILQAHLMGAEPSITVRLLGGTPDQAAQAGAIC